MIWFITSLPNKRTLLNKLSIWLISSSITLSAPEREEHSRPWHRIDWLDEWRLLSQLKVISKIMTIWPSVATVLKIKCRLFSFKYRITFRCMSSKNSGPCAKSRHYGISKVRSITTHSFDRSQILWLASIQHHQRPPYWGNKWFHSCHNQTICTEMNFLSHKHLHIVQRSFRTRLCHRCLQDGRLVLQESFWEH